MKQYAFGDAVLFFLNQFRTPKPQISIPETLQWNTCFYSYFLIFVHYSKYGRNTR